MESTTRRTPEPAETPPEPTTPPASEPPTEEKEMAAPPATSAEPAPVLVVDTPPETSTMPTPGEESDHEPTPSMVPVTTTSPAPSQPNIFQRWYDGAVAWTRANPRNASMVAIAVLLFILGFFIRVDTPHVSLAGQPILANGPAWFTNSLLTTFVVDIVVIVLGLLSVSRMQLVPSGLQNLMETMLEAVYGLADGIAGRAASTYFPYVATIFLFVLVCNWSGLIPGVGSIEVEHVPVEEAQSQVLDNQLAMANGKLMLQESATSEAEEEHEEHVEAVPLFRAPSADLNMTFALAIATMFLVQYYGVKALGGIYWRKFMFWRPSGHGYLKVINGFVSFLEVISELSRILTFSFRLFGNIFAGEVVLATMAFLFAFLVPVPFYALEVLVGVIQAVVFTMLALILFSLATASHDHPEEHDLPMT